jgi:DNA polymerase-3 subunit delta'
MEHPRYAKEIYGHDEAINAFKSAALAGKLHHAWLLYGPKGIGKSSTAYHFAKYLLGSDERTTKLIENKTHPDMFVIESESDEDNIGKEIKLEEVRNLHDFLHMTPAFGKRKVVIIDPVEMLNNNGVNALLKALEEPATHTTFLLICNSFGAMPATVRSRCCVLKFRQLNIQDFEKVLTKVEPGQKDYKTLYELSDGSLHMTGILAEARNLELLNRVKKAIDISPQLGLDELLSLKKALASDEAWHCFKQAILRLLLMRIKANALAGKDIDSLLHWYDESLQLMKDQEIFNLDQENVALTILAKS